MFNKDLAKKATLHHDERENFHKKCISCSDFVTSKSGTIYPNVNTENIREMVDLIKIANKKAAQGLYDDLNDELNTVYAIIKENINSDRRRKLDMLEENKRVNDDINIEEEKKQIEDRYKELNEDNLRNVGRLKGELRGPLLGGDIELRGMDENDKDSVELFEEALKSVKTDDKNSVSSLDTHNPLDQTPGNES